MDARSTAVADRLELPLLVAALLTIPSTIIEESHLSRPWPQLATYLNWAIWLTFLAEVVIMLAVVPSKKAWLRHHPLEIVTVVLTPPALMTAVQPIGLLRLLRVFRLLRLARCFACSCQSRDFSTRRRWRFSPPWPAGRRSPRSRTTRLATGSTERSRR